MINLRKRIFSSQASKEGVGRQVILAGWAQDIRLLGKLAFVILRDREGDIQLTFLKSFPELKSLTRESVIAVQGKVVKGKSKKYAKEVVVDSLEVLSKAQTPLPIEFKDLIKTGLPKRLNWRHLDLRNKKVRSIFSIQSEICKAFRDFFRNKGFIEIWPPEIIGAAAEGGTELFHAVYFDKKVYLAQSPQLYKQMIIMSDVEKVFSIAPIFRAEPHDTHKHLNESRQMDIELAFAGQLDAIKLLDEAVKYIVRSVLKNCKEEVNLLNPGLKVPNSKLVSYDKAVKVLSKKGFKIKWGEDISSEGEHKLADIFGKQTLIHIHSWPSKLKPFYIFPKGSKLTEGFDTDYGGLELASGGQRVHIPDILIKQLKDKKLNPANFKFYIDAFRYGAPIHSGWSIGLERLTMVITNQSNIREACLYPRDRERVSP